MAFMASVNVSERVKYVVRHVTTRKRRARTLIMINTHQYRLWVVIYVYLVRYAWYNIILYIYPVISGGIGMELGRPWGGWPLWTKRSSSVRYERASAYVTGPDAESFSRILAHTGPPQIRKVCDGYIIFFFPLCPPPPYTAADKWTRSEKNHLMKNIPTNTKK